MFNIILQQQQHLNDDIHEETLCSYAYAISCFDLSNVINNIKRNWFSHQFSNDFDYIEAGNAGIKLGGVLKLSEPKLVHHLSLMVKDYQEKRTH